MRTTPALWLAAMLLAFQLTPAAQLEFDAASVKESTIVSSGGNLRLMPGGGITAQHISARQYITIAYTLQQFQLAGAPDWARDTYYDIVAKPAAAATREQTLVMLQSLLRERFKLTSHRERRQMDGFALVRARANDLGPGLRSSAVNCETRFAAEPRCREGHFTVDAAGKTLKSVGVPMWSLLQIVINDLSAPVSDDTRLAGTFDIDMRWSSEVAPGDDLPSLVTALQDQLGLKLERRRVDQEIFIIDHIERPAPN